jgi:hypothetical protein
MPGALRFKVGYMLSAGCVMVTEECIQDGRARAAAENTGDQQEYGRARPPGLTQ